MAFPTYTKTFHNSSYPAIDPTNPALSTAGKVVVITGGGSGLGPHIAHAFATSGCTKIALIGRTPSTLLATKTFLLTLHPTIQVLTFTADITSLPSITHALSNTASTFGPIDILISNAAYCPDPSPIGTGPIDEWFRGMEVNVKGNLYLIQTFLQYCTAENPIFVHVSTGSAHLPLLGSGMSGYAISELAATRVMDYFGMEHPGVRVMNVHPGVLETEMNKKAVEAGFVLPFDDVELSASFIVWSVSPEAEFLQGKLIWANWDVEELKAKKEILGKTDELTIGLIGWGA
ncbi:NAD(P)-binding protein [Cadophora sp. DSE1049]|nr:NAD(P)-binding protein [Cadophora sp. DSE1049]